MNRISTPRRLAAAALLGGVMLLLASAPASAHAIVAPDAAAKGEVVTYTLGLPAEGGKATIGAEVTMPAGFDLLSATVKGWRLAVKRSPNGVATVVTWSGGRIPSGGEGVFTIRGRNPQRPGTLVWKVVQQLERGTLAWTGPLGSQNPAPQTRVADGPVGPATTVPSGRSTGPARAATPAVAVDQLARSRAALGITLGGTGLLLGLAALVIVLRMRADSERPAPPFVAPPNPEAPPAQQRQPARRRRR